MANAILLLFLFSSALGQLLRLEIKDIVIHPNDFLVGSVVILFLIGKLRKRENPFQGRLRKPLFAFIFFAGLSLLGNTFFLTPQQFSVSFLYFARFVAYSFLYFLVLDLKKTDPTRENILKIVIIAGVAISLFGFIQYLFYPDLLPLSAIGWDPHYYRLVSSFLDPSFTGIILVIAFLVAIYRFWPILGKTTILPFLVLTTLYLAIALTYSRASYLALIASVLVLAKILGSKTFAVFFFAIFAITIFLLPRPDSIGTKLERRDTVWSRIENWQETLSVISQNPVFGVGFNAYRYRRIEKDYSRENYLVSHSGAGADSSLLFAWATSGIGGFLSLIWLIKEAIGVGKKLNQREKALISAILLGLFVHSFFANSLFYPWVMELFWVVFALLEQASVDKQPSFRQ